MTLVNLNTFDELVLLISRLSDEKSKHILLSKAADVYGRGGKTRINALTGTTIPTLIVGKADSEDESVIASSRIRKEGGGRKSTTEIYPSIEARLLYVVLTTSSFRPTKQDIRLFPLTSLF